MFIRLNWNSAMTKTVLSYWYPIQVWIKRSNLWRWLWLTVVGYYYLCTLHFNRFISLWHRGRFWCTVSTKSYYTRVYEYGIKHESYYYYIPICLNNHYFYLWKHWSYKLQNFEISPIIFVIFNKYFKT